MDTRELKEIIESVLSEMNVTGSAAAAEEGKPAQNNIQVIRLEKNI